jgi:isopentenyl-diphosphate delta-isomerase
MIFEEPELILVNDHDEQTGTMKKMEAHTSGSLHRAFSIFIFDSNGRWLLQKRAAGKYHSAGLWSNTCCGHPVNNELIYDAAVKRLHEEMGMNCRLEEKFSFIYKAELENNLTEHEFDHVFTGVSDKLPVVNTEEVSEYRYIGTEELRSEINSCPENFTAWLKIIFEKTNGKIFR